VRTLLIALLGSNPFLFGQQAQQVLISIGGAAASNIILLHSTTCNNTTGATTVVCTVPSTTAGSFLEITEEDADNPAAPSLPTGEATAVQDGTFPASANGRTTIFHVASSNGGVTTITGHPATSTHSSMNVREYTGVSSSAPLDAITAGSTYLSNVSTASPLTDTLSASQIDLVIAVCSEGSSANSHYVAGPGFGNIADFPQPNDATDTAAVDLLNGTKGQYTGYFTADSHNHNCVLALYKSAVAGSAPSGDFPSVYADFENSTNGTTVTAAILAAGTHGGPCQINGAGAGGWTLTGAALIVSTSGEKATVNTHTTQGTTYTAPDSGTRGLRYDPGNGGATANCALQTSQGTVTAGVWWQSPATVPDTTTHSVLTVANPGNDFAAISLVAGQSYMVCETFGGDSAIHIAISASTWYRLTVQYIAGGTHSCAVYDASGTQVGSTATHAATGNFKVTTVEVGNSHGGAGTVGNFAYVDNLVIDWLNNTFPILP
jgi:hypothetical protein